MPHLDHRLEIRELWVEEVCPSQSELVPSSRGAVGLVHMQQLQLFSNLRVVLGRFLIVHIAHDGLFQVSDLLLDSFYSFVTVLGCPLFVTVVR